LDTLSYIERARVECCFVYPTNFQVLVFKINFQRSKHIYNYPV